MRGRRDPSENVARDQAHGDAVGVVDDIRIVDSKAEGRGRHRAGATTTSVAIACMAIVVDGFSSALTHTDDQRSPPGLSTRANSAVALATSGKNMYPKRTETPSNVASSNRRSSALHTSVSILATP